MLFHFGAYVHVDSDQRDKKSLHLGPSPRLVKKDTGEEIDSHSTMP